MWPMDGLTQNKAHDWVNKKRREQASCHLWPFQKQRGRCMTASGGGQEATASCFRSCNLCQAVTRLPVANHILLESWMVHISQNLTDWGQLPWRGTWATWDLRSLHTRDREAWTWEVHAVLGCGNPSVFYPAGVLTTYSSDVCFQSHSLSTAQLSQWSWISGHIFPLVRAKIIHWRYLQAEEANLKKIRENCPRSGRCKRWKILQLSLELCIWGATAETWERLTWQGINWH